MNNKLESDKKKVRRSQIFPIHIIPILKFWQTFVLFTLDVMIKNF